MEAQTVAKFNHPNIVRIRSYFKQNNTAYIVMDYYDGNTLDFMIKESGGQVSEDVAMGIMMPILDGLRKVHAEHLLHRDLKPSNIFITSTGKPVLLDFGSRLPDSILELKSYWKAVSIPLMESFPLAFIMPPDYGVSVM